MLRTVIFHGALADKFQPVKMDVHNTPTLLAGLKSIYPEFKKHISKLTQFAVVAAKTTGEKKEIVKTNDALFPFEDATEIHIVPAVEGDWWQALVYVFETYGVVAAVAYVAVSFLVLSSIAQALAPKPPTSQSSNKDSSFIFNGPQNITRQGGAVPILYGTAIVGSVIIASDYISVDLNSYAGANTYPHGGGGLYR